jgi:hypothetical protein
MSGFLRFVIEKSPSLAPPQAWDSKYLSAVASDDTVDESSSVDIDARARLLSQNLLSA